MNDWFSLAQTWSEANPMAFQGTHEVHVLMMIDEASGVPRSIWETIFGALTTIGGILIAFGNPNLNTGMFFDCFGKLRHRWTTKRVDSRDVTFGNKKEMEDWIEDFGLDSDFCRVRIRGLFPRQSSIQLISSEAVLMARKREIKDSDLSPASPLIMGIDIAREGDDFSAFMFRKGSKMYPYKRYQERNSMANASILSHAINQNQPDLVFIDAGSVGGAVYDRLLQLGHTNVIPVYFGSAAEDPRVYANKRIEIWCRMAVWIDAADLPDEQLLSDELCTPTYGQREQTEVMVLESKKKMKARGEPSPDVGDALAVTFAHIVPVRMTGAEVATEPEIY